MLGKSEALLELGGHSHWVWRAQYSPFYEQLLASSSSDTLVNLYHTPQLASSSTGSGGQEGTGGEAPSQAGAGIVRWVLRLLLGREGLGGCLATNMSSMYCLRIRTAAPC